jgi:hypothetical protein
VILQLVRIRSVACSCPSVGACALALAEVASAKWPLWRLEEIFRNAGGSVPSVDLPRQNTFRRSTLCATPAFAALPGAGPAAA